MRLRSHVGVDRDFPELSENDVVWKNNGKPKVQSLPAISADGVKLLLEHNVAVDFTVSGKRTNCRVGPVKMKRLVDSAKDCMRNAHSCLFYSADIVTAFPQAQGEVKNLDQQEWHRDDQHVAGDIVMVVNLTKVTEESGPTYVEGVVPGSVGFSCAGDPGSRFMFSTERRHKGGVNVSSSPRVVLIMRYRKKS